MELNRRKEPLIGEVLHTHSNCFLCYESVFTYLKQGSKHSLSKIGYLAYLKYFLNLWEWV